MKAMLLKFLLGRLIRRWRTPDHPLDETAEPFNSTDEEAPMGEAWKSHGRSALKMLGVALVAAGALDAGSVDVLIQATEALVGAGMALYGLWLSHKQHA